MTNQLKNDDFLMSIWLCVLTGTQCAEIRQNIVKLTLLGWSKKGQNTVVLVTLFFGYFSPLIAVKMTSKNRQIDLENWLQKAVKKLSKWPSILTSKKQLKRVEILSYFVCKKNAPMWIRSPYSPYPWFLILWLWPLCHEGLLNRWI